LPTSVSGSAVLSALGRVPPFPPIAARLLSLLATKSVEISHVAELVGSDPTLSARILQFVNSAEFGLASPVTDVQHALTFLGLDRTYQVTVTLATAAYAKGALRTTELRRCWEHTMATAILADQIAHACGAFTDVAYTAGIIHDIGRLGLLVAYPQEYERVIRDAADRCVDLLEFETEHFGVHHAEAGRILCERWGLPADFLIVAGRHHDACEGSELDLLRIVHVACSLADALGFDITRPLIPPDLHAILSALPVRARTRFQSAPKELRLRIEERIGTYGHNDTAPPDDPPPATEPETDPPPAVRAASQPRPIGAAALALTLAAALGAVIWFLLLR
jgi:HD-like signal output (HDOD) protein